MFKKVEKLIDEHIPSKESGTYETSLSMIDKIEKIGGISYIAHINSSNLRNTTSLYKKTLFNHIALNVIGLTSSDKENQLRIINSYGVAKQLDKFCFIYEGDSHQINEIGKKNTWIKMSIASFGSLKKAFINHKLSVFIDKPTSTNKFIKGLLIDPGKHGYLKKKNGDEPFVINFSSDLNCIIGGRGTGKSTILNVLEVVFTLEANSKSVLKFISRNNLIIIHFVYLEKEYLLKFIPQLKKDHIYSDYRPFEEEAIIEEVNSERIVLSHHWIELYRVNKIGEAVNFKIIDDVEEKKEILNGVYRKSYSINNIIEQINKGKIGEFIKEVVFNGLPFKERDTFLKTFEKLSKPRMRTFLEAELPLIDKSMDARKGTIEASLKEFNSIHKNHFSIIYSPKLDNSLKYIDILVGDFNNRQFLSGYRITWGGIERFIVDVCNKMDFMKFLTLLFQNKFKEIERQVSVLSYQVDRNLTFSDVDQNRKHVELKDITDIYRTIRNKLLSDRERLIKCFQLYFEVIDDFSIMFNTSSKEIVTTIAPIMKDINEISLGQKVVAILTFIFEYGKHFNDNTPLIIDQPEDNLDNQYIYKNLVNSLKQIKNNRQIIIVTHSSTIVTNADAEQVVILDSDSKNGWIEKKGYPDNDVVTKHIINYLEGGEESFKHKIGMYEKVLQK
ncbi:AAA family ATPase [Paenibacillus tundrae]